MKQDLHIKDSEKDEEYLLSENDEEEKKNLEALRKHKEKAFQESNLPEKSQNSASNNPTKLISTNKRPYTEASLAEMFKIASSGLDESDNLEKIIEMPKETKKKSFN